MRTDAAPLGWGWTTRTVVGLIGLVLAVSSNSPALRAQSGTVGRWDTLSYLMPINPVHSALMNNGKVLIVSGSGNVAAETDFRYAVLDLQTEQVSVTHAQPWDMFCNGMVVLSDGRVLVNGGNLAYDPFHGQRKNAVFDPATGVFTDVQSMLHGRWYPTVTTLGDGRVMTFSGLDENGNTNTTVEIYTPGSNSWSQPYSAGWTPPLYPRMHLLPDGRVLYSGSGTGSRIFNPSAQPTPTWTGVIATTNYSGSRGYGTSVLLPLRPGNAYKGKVMIFGGGNPATATTETLDTSAPTLQWQNGPPMSQPRIEMNATILPNGKILATGGSTKDEDATTKSLNADLYDPATNTFSSAGQNVYARLYHSNALLLPDATVLLLGGNPARGTYEQHMEIYSPAYLFNLDGTPAPRPVISGATSSVSYGAGFQIATADAANIAQVVLVRPGAPTHAFDMEQRLVELPFTAAAGVLNVTGPPNGNIAPPGYYMLFILNSAGVPSVATFVRVVAGPPNQAPTASIDSPTSNVTINPGDAVAFSGSGTDTDGSIASYAWTFPGGSPASSAVAAPGNVTYGAPGSYTATFKVTDNGGLTSPTQTRTITVADFSVSASPASQSVVMGNSVGYTVSVVPAAGFTGTVVFSVTGLPSGATPSFTPASVDGSGSSSLSISTSASTPAGTYPLTVRGTIGSVTRTAAVTLVVTAPVNQAPTASIDSPAASSVTVNPGGTVSFSGSGSDSDGTVTAYAWTFAGGSPASSTSAVPGNVTYGTPGTYTATFKVTDNGGVTSTTQSRTITVTDFAVTATPGSATAVAGANAAYTASVTPGPSFTGIVDFSVMGLPAGATVSFNPTSVATSGSSLMTVTTSSSTPPGSYALTVRGTSGGFTRTASVTLVVTPAGDFAISANPTSHTVNNGSDATYTVTVTSSPDFSSTVSLSIGALPKFVTATFSPASVTGSGTSVLTLSTKKQTKPGASTITLTGTSGPLVRSTTITLVVQ